MRKLCYVLFVLVALSATAMAATPIAVDKIEGSVPIISYLSWLEDPKGTIDYTTASASDTQSSYKALTKGFGLRATGAGWLKLELGRSTQGNSIYGPFSDVPLLLNTSFLPTGGAVFYSPGGAGQAPWFTNIHSNQNIYMAEPSLNNAVYYVYFLETPGLWFAPTLNRGENATPSMPPEMILPALLLACIIICLLRCLKTRQIWPFWLAITVACVLAEIFLPLPRSGEAINFTHLPALLAPGIALILFPHVGRIVLQSRQRYTVADFVLCSLSLIGVVVCLAPLVPGYLWLTRLFPLWGLLLLPIATTTDKALAREQRGALAYLAACWLPAAGATLALVALKRPELHEIVSQGTYWGLAVGCLTLALTPVSLTAIKKEDVDDEDEDFIDLNSFTMSEEFTQTLAAEQQAVRMSTEKLAPPTDERAYLSFDKTPHAVAKNADTQKEQHLHKPLQGQSFADYFAETEGEVRGKAVDDQINTHSDFQQSLQPNTQLDIQNTPYPSVELYEEQPSEKNFEHVTTENTFTTISFTNTDTATETHQYPSIESQKSNHWHSEESGTLDIPKPSDMTTLAGSPDIAVDPDHTVAAATQGAKVFVATTIEKSDDSISVTTDISEAATKTPLPSMQSFGKPEIGDAYAQSLLAGDIAALNTMSTDIDSAQKFAIANSENALAENTTRTEALQLGTNVNALKDVESKVDSVLAHREDEDNVPKTTRVVYLNAEPSTPLSALEEPQTEVQTQENLPQKEEFVFDLHSLVREVHHALAPLAERKNILLSWYMAPTLPTLLLGDAMGLHETLSQLLHNAITATDEGTVQLYIRAHSDGNLGSLFFTIKDSGTSQHNDATLAYALEFAGRNNGTASIQNATHNGKTIDFSATFALPDAQMVTTYGQTTPHNASIATLEEAISPVQTEHTYTSQNSVPVEEAVQVEQTHIPPQANTSVSEPAPTQQTTEPSPAPVLSETPTPTVQNEQLIVVTDMTTSNWRLLASYFSEVGLPCVEAKTIKDAETIAKVIRPSLIIYDGDSPEDSIVSSLKFMCSLPYTKGLLVVTSSDSQGQRLLEKGATHFLIKPFPKENLFTVTEQAAPNLFPPQPISLEVIEIIERITGVSPKNFVLSDDSPFGNEAPQAISASTDQTSQLSLLAKEKTQPQQIVMAQQTGLPKIQLVQKNTSAQLLDISTSVQKAPPAQKIVFSNHGQGTAENTQTNMMSSQTANIGTITKKSAKKNIADLPSLIDFIVPPAEETTDEQVTEQANMVQAPAQPTPAQHQPAPQAMINRQNNNANAPSSVSPTQPPHKQKTDDQTPVLLPDLDGETMKASVKPLVPGLLHTLNEALTLLRQGIEKQENSFIQQTATSLAIKANTFGLFKLEQMSTYVAQSAVVDDFVAVSTLVDDLINMTVRHIASLEKYYQSYLEEARNQ